jgi:hypothetical protein
MFLNELKYNLQSGECIVLCNVAENYSFILQDFHWNNTQATTHPSVIYFKTDVLNTEHETLVMISDCLKHDSILVHSLQLHLISFLKTHLNHHWKETVYFSDGSAAQYKQTNRKPYLLHGTMKTLECQQSGISL